MAEATFNPIYKPLELDTDFEVPEGQQVILHELFLTDPNTYLFVEDKAIIWFI